MSENSTLQYFVDEGSLQSNGKPDLNTFKDNRLQLTVDGRHVETWELMIVEELNVGNWIMLFSRYLHRGDKLVSPGLPSKPIDELTRAEVAQIKNSDAYKLLKHFPAPSLKQAAQSFARQASTFDDDPN